MHFHRRSRLVKKNETASAAAHGDVVLLRLMIAHRHRLSYRRNLVEACAASVSKSLCGLTLTTAEAVNHLSELHPDHHGLRLLHVYDGTDGVPWSRTGRIST